MPIASLAPVSAGEEASGSSPKSSFSNLLDAEDLRRAKAALSTALDPQGNGSPVAWDNPESGTKGSIAPIGKAYPADAKICRVFISQVDRKGDEQSMRGTACAENGGDWTIAQLSPFKKI